MLSGRPGVELVGLHQVPLHGDAPGHHLLWVFPEMLPAQQVQQVPVPDHTVLDDLGTAVGKDVIRESIQGVQVAEDQTGLIEGSGQILAPLQVDGGLAPHRGIHRRQEGGGKLEEGHPPQEGGGGKAGEVPHHAAPQGNQGVGASDLVLCQELQQV